MYTATNYTPAASCDTSKYSRNRFILTIGFFLLFFHVKNSKNKLVSTVHKNYIKELTLNFEA